MVAIIMQDFPDAVTAGLQLTSARQINVRWEGRERTCGVQMLPRIW
ncbi:MAG: hypothetical protein UY90_C0050G0004 [Candidatus Peregrinibacteria bacterium GW2011_GWA2_54_9]|nr:MAG: hypothetical protein UY90_C0050G0004 [Candidatus Peregrinibacteria bacterium GW2011_GWA2_54_9]